MSSRRDGPWGQPSAGNPLGGPIILALIVLAVIVWASSRRDRLPRPTSDPSATSTGRPLGDRRLSIEFLDVGQGDAALIRSPEGKLALVDAGPSDRVVDLLRDRGVERLDLAVVSHHHADHYEGMLKVVRAFRPRVFLDADSPMTSKHYEALLRAVRDEDITAIQPQGESRRITLGSVSLTVLPQPPVDSHNENNNSIGLRVEYGDFAALLTGDSEVRERAWWSEHVPELVGHVTVLKLAHHGSRNGTSDAWLALTRPELAVGSMGWHNEFGHPHPETLRRLSHDSIPLRRTDQDGSITVTTDGVSWALATTRSRPAAPPTTSDPEQAAAGTARRRGSRFRPARTRRPRRPRTPRRAAARARRPAGRSG